MQARSPDSTARLRRAAGAAVVTGATLARFRSRCTSCDEPIVEGDAIVQVDGGEWEHEECAVREGYLRIGDDEMEGNGG